MLSYPSVHNCTLETLQHVARSPISITGGCYGDLCHYVEITGTSSTHNSSPSWPRVPPLRAVSLLFVKQLPPTVCICCPSSARCYHDPCFLLQALSQEVPFHTTGPSCLCVRAELPSSLAAFSPSEKQHS